jgi:hypothetical protein
MIALFALAAMLATNSDQVSPAQSPVPAVDVIPEIGRTKSRAPACVALQDLVAPSFAAAMRADQQFNQAAPQFAAYAGAKDATTILPTGMVKASGTPLQTRRMAEDSDSATPEMYLARLDKSLADMVKNVLAIGKALSDPRLASDSQDPAVQSEREQLQRLYAVQVGRISVLQEFLARQRMDRTKNDRNITNSTSLDGRGVGTADLAAAAAAALDSGHVADLLGQPSLNGLAGNDKQSMNDWTNRIARTVKDNENSAAQTFYNLARNCM